MTARAGYRVHGQALARGGQEELCSCIVLLPSRNAAMPKRPVTLTPEMFIGSPFRLLSLADARARLQSVGRERPELPEPASPPQDRERTWDCG